MSCINETALDEMERLVRDLQSVDRDIKSAYKQRAEAANCIALIDDTLYYSERQRDTIKARLLELAQWIST